MVPINKERLLTDTVHELANKLAEAELNLAFAQAQIKQLQSAVSSEAATSDDSSSSD